MQFPKTCLKEPLVSELAELVDPMLEPANPDRSNTSDKQTVPIRTVDSSCCSMLEPYKQTLQNPQKSTNPTKLGKHK